MRTIMIILALIVTLGTQVGLTLSKKRGLDRDQLMNVFSSQLQSDPTDSQSDFPLVKDEPAQQVLFKGLR
tara:strand:- start:53 stop:262 length:210 start_codon:yes stop_codon:yes gene_type:complete